MWLIRILLITFALSSCVKSNQKFDCIELIGYGYIKVPSSNDLYEEEWKLVAPIYLHIDNEYCFQFIFEKKIDTLSYIGLDGKELGFEGLINQIVDSSANLSENLDLRPGILFFNHGFEIKIKINKNDHSKTIHFWQDYGQVYEELFNLAAQMCLNSKEKSSDIDAFILKKRYDFMIYAGQSDSVLRPLPPLPPKDVKPQYIPPRIDSSLLKND